uniref:Uncharacterized protein n=1 Tax=Cucumis melo TaxID=3656 RepID=A0A9I9E294_CUCME
MVSGMANHPFIWCLFIMALWGRKLHYVRERYLQHQIRNIYDREHKEAIYPRHTGNLDIEFRESANEQRRSVTTHKLKELIMGITLTGLGS